MCKQTRSSEGERLVQQVQSGEGGTVSGFVLVFSSLCCSVQVVQASGECLRAVLATKIGGQVLGKVEEMCLENEWHLYLEPFKPQRRKKVREDPVLCCVTPCYAASLLSMLCVMLCYAARLWTVLPGLHCPVARCYATMLLLCNMCGSM